MNAVLIAVIIMLALALLRVHVVVALFIGAIVGGLLSGMGLDATMLAFQDGLGGGAKIALSYALLGAFAMGVASARLPQILANFLIAKLGGSGELNPKAAATTKWMLVIGLIAMAVMSQNLIPVHIAFIPLLIPPLLAVMNKLKLDRRLITTCLTFGLITTYMFIPVGFGSIYLNDILLFNIEQAGLDTSNINIMQVMAIPALGMLTGLIIAIFISYRAPREYEERPLAAVEHQETPSRYKIGVSILAIVATFAVQIIMQALDFESDGLLVGALTGLGILLISGAVDWKHADDVFSNGMKMMALIGFIMITAQGFASVMTATGEVGPLVDATANLFGTNKCLSAGAMLLVGLVVTMGIGSSFSTLPIISVIYVPLCFSLGFSPAATVALIGTAGALGDAGSPASDSTLGPTAGLGADGQHDHIRDSVIPTFIHFNIPLLIAGWAGALIL
ncbi:TRAP transporter large permease subunit [Corynebacterium macginleyi]|uniref:TRAP transporter large permease subunit n=1 Tax=Corynebacterium macginleyi TaxID=38290 RepID=A0A3M0FZ14_9CORY|nr:Na+/H+ antiporter NhaC family protein [Corynebacterium macginleyi]MBK4157374.1 TRAP transporter large permease subunit [Corynebacterium macginleyi]RMB57894.1 TRAP transporter large permease subunit [Corynebacterium macginleyi]